MTQSSTEHAEVNALGRRLREQRIRAGLTQEELAKKVGSHRVTVAHIERGYRMPSPLLVTHLAQALGISRDALDAEAARL